MFSQTLDLPRHTDLWVQIAVRRHRAPVDMTGWTISIPQADAWTEANATIEWVDQAQGVALVRAKWTEDTPSTLRFRVKFSNTASDFADAIYETIVRYS